MICYSVSSNVYVCVIQYLDLCCENITNPLLQISVQNSMQYQIKEDGNFRLNQGTNFIHP